MFHRNTASGNRNSLSQLPQDFDQKPGSSNGWRSRKWRAGPIHLQLQEFAELIRESTMKWRGLYWAERLLRFQTESERNLPIPVQRHRELAHFPPTATTHFKFRGNLQEHCHRRTELRSSEL